MEGEKSQKQSVTTQHCSLNLSTATLPLLLVSDVCSDENAVITLVRFQGELFPRLDHLSLKLLYFLGKDGLGGCR